MEDAFQTLKGAYDNAYDVYYLHVKKTDSRGKDGDFDLKVAVIEAVDQLMPGIVELEPAVLVVTADHSTPVSMKSHSWFPSINGPFPKSRRQTAGFLVRRTVVRLRATPCFP
jgi:2,3-bisphosphoglycerate-independent phosphoglycerate mutase